MGNAEGNTRRHAGGTPNLADGFGDARRWPLNRAEPHESGGDWRATGTRLRPCRRVASIGPVDFDFAILADGVAQRPDGKLDIFGAGFDTIYAAAVPARHHQIAFALRLFLSRHEAENPHRVD